ncbi:hypothetical protein BXZ70DRAFT_916659 [Cristinia sonorae]|uniref:Uncharacterized protein n=1 Tax=Cristinia sonorae TaxID=1940300 RepID=A0A8K0XUQ0_9AGAR|nr:hypothetical protein BXZ70DRAFT_916659 [Cristinia sonorae]
MTTLSVMEPLDENMLDYPADADIQMLSGSAPTAFWLSQEAAMDDDSNTLTLDSRSNHSETIEVDMEPHDHDEEMTEYDMDDAYFTNEVEVEAIPDVEVTHSPQPFAAIAPGIEEVGIVPHAIPPDLEPPMPHLETVVPSAPEVHVQAIEEQPTLIHESVPTGHFHGAVSPAPEVIVAPPAQESISSTLEASFVQVVGEAQLDGPVTAFSDLVQSETYPSLENAEAAGSSMQEVPTDTLPVPDGPSDGPEEPPAVAIESTIESNGEVVEKPSEVLSRPDTQLAGGDADFHTSYEELGEDPLEISDGVYIDPPPAVLFNLASGSEEEVEYSLFNQPNPDAYPGESSSTSTVSQHMTVLLHDQPTLYYEPLNKVFEALRGHEIIHGVSEFTEGELVLDAYDLQLTISEDNVHASEVTIHELNVLHDASGLQGPLRMRLYALTPRFISRYYTLREQLTRLHIVGEAHAHDGENEGAAGEDYHDDGALHHENEAEPQHGPRDGEDDGESADVQENVPRADDAEEIQRWDEAEHDDYEGGNGTLEQHPADSHEKTVQFAEVLAIPNDVAHDVHDHGDHTEEVNSSTEGEHEHSDPTAHDPQGPLDAGVGTLADDEGLHGEGVSVQFDGGYAEEDNTFPDEEEQQVSTLPEAEATEEHDDPTSTVATFQEANDQSTNANEGDNVAHEVSAEFLEEYADPDADGEYEDDLSYHANEDGELQDFEDPQAEDDELYAPHTSVAETEQNCDKSASEPIQATLSGSSGLPELSTEGEEDDFEHQELLEFEDELEEVPSDLAHKPAPSPVRGDNASPTTSSKRTYDQLESGEDEYPPPDSPDSKRLRAV